MGNLKNLATGTVLTAPSPATSGPSLVLQSGEGARMPTTPFYAIAHPDGSYPTLDNAEIIQVTNVATDTLTIVRAQLSTTAKSISVTWRLSNPFLKEDYDAKQDLDATLTALAAFNSNGSIHQTAADTFAARTLTGTANQLTVTNGNGVSGNPTISLPADVQVPTILTTPNTGLHVLDTDASHDLIFKPGSNITADRTLTVTTGDADRLLSILGDVSLVNALSIPDNFALTLNQTGTSSVTLPTTGTLATRAGAETLTNKTMDSTSPTAFFFPGFIQGYGSRIAPSGWLACDGSNVSRTTYAGLFAAVNPSLGTFTVTIAAPAVVSKTAHGLSTGDAIYLTTTGALPTGLTANTLYYVVRVDANSFNLSTSRANAYAATKITTTGTQSGVHTAWDCPYGLGDGSTTFTLPDLRGRTPAGMDTTGGTAASRLTLAQSQGTYGNLGASGGEQGHTLVLSESPSHTHKGGYTDANWKGNAAAGSSNILISFNTSDVNNLAVNSTSQGGDGAHNTVAPTQLINYIIKT